LFAFLLLLALGSTLARADGDGLFRVQGRRPESAVVTAHWAAPPAADIPESDMLRAILGIVSTLSARDLRDLERSVAEQTRVGPDLIAADKLWTIHLRGVGGPGAKTRSIEIGRVEYGWLLAESEGFRVRLESSIVDRIARDWPTPRPDPAQTRALVEADPADSTPPSEPEAIELRPRPVASPIRLDAGTLSERFARGRPSPFNGPLRRTVDAESFRLRLPVSFDLDRPIPLIVWINASEDDAIPEELAAVADGAGYAIIAPSAAGNDRPVVDRMQVVLDAVPTALRVIWVDPERVVVAGLSGGGRLASMLWSATPDVFTGAMPIAGLNSWHDIPTGQGTVWAGTHQPPVGSLGQTLRAHPLAAISGPRDFNFIEARARVEQLRRDNFTARLFDIPGLGHTMPPPAALRDALAWIDHPVTSRREQQAEAAGRLLDSIPAEVLENPAAELTERQRRTLERVTEVAPWTEPAWTAAARLGFTPSAPGAP
jgi:hypothetical protein